MESAIEFLVGKNNKDNFLNQYWGKSTFINYESVRDSISFSINDLENIFTHSRLSSMDLRLSSVDGSVMPFQYCDEDGTVNIQKLFFFFNRGSTIILRSVENFNPRLQNFCKRLKVDFGNIKRLFINLYLTPENSQGFFHHYDTEDVFIFQIEGEKEWLLYDAPYPLPLEDQHFSIDTVKPNKSSLKKVMLKTGEILYIPRGVIHEAKAQDKISCHLTISIVPFTWADILSEYQKKCIQSDISIRASIPANISYKTAKQFVQKIHKKVQDDILKSVVTRYHDQYISDIKSQFNAQGILTRRSKLLDDSLSVSLNSELYKGVHFAEETIELKVGQVDILLPIGAKSIVDFIFLNKKCKIKAIPSKYVKKDKLVILERLIRDSFLKIVKE